MIAAVALGGCAGLPAADTARIDGPIAAVDAPAAPASAAQPALVAPGVAQADIDAALAHEAQTRAHIDPAQDIAPRDLWHRLRGGFAMADLDDERVHKWERYYAGQPHYVQRMATRGSRYLFHIVQQLEARGMPTELALLPFVESAFNPQAVSSAKASGMWQFMPATGRDFDLRQNVFRDDRRDVLASTRAALDYLQRLHAQFGDWHLALAAYNWGQGSVQRAIERNRRAGLPTDYSTLRMPDETRNYVPKLQAVKNLVARPDDFGLTLPELQDHPYFLSVVIERDIDVALAARLAGLTVEEFQSLNPQHRKPVILAAGTPQVLLPYDNANRFVRDLALERGPLASWTAWVAPRTLKPAAAAELVGMDEAELRAVNGIPARMLIKAGSTLLVPRGEAHGDDVDGHLADHATMALAPDTPPLRRVTHRVGKKSESVAAVARRYRVATAAVAKWNGVSTRARFAPGTRVVVLVPSAPVRTAAARSAKPRVAAATSKSTPRAASKVARSKSGASNKLATTKPRASKVAGAKQPSVKTARAKSKPPKTARAKSERVAAADDSDGRDRAR